VRRTVTYGVLGMGTGGVLAVLAHYAMVLFLGPADEYLFPLVLIGAVPGGVSCAFLGLIDD
jgi:hypothetical protein